VQAAVNKCPFCCFFSTFFFIVICCTLIALFSFYIYLFSSTMKAIVVAVALLAVFASASHLNRFAVPFTKMGKFSQAVLTPAKLPCSFAIKFAGQQMDDHNKTLVHFTERIAYDGGLLSVKNSFVESKTTGIDVIRADMREKDQGEYLTPLFSALLSNTTTECWNKKITDAEVKEDYDAVLSKFNEKSYFDGVKDTIFHGKKCHMFYTDRDEKNYHLRVYVDKDNYIVGLYEQDNHDIFVVDISYEFNVPMSYFTFDRAEFKGCNDQAYIAPKEQCH